MASQEHLAMLYGDDDDTTSTSSNDSESSSSELEAGLSAGSAGANSLSTSAEGATATALPQSKQNSEGDDSSVPMPAKKRIRLHIGRAMHAASKSSVEVSAEADEVVVSEQDGVKSSGKQDENLLTVEAKHISSSTDSIEPIDKENGESAKPSRRRKLPMNKKTIERATTEGTEVSQDSVPRATIVDSDDGGEDDVVAAVIEDPVPSKAKSSSSLSDSGLASKSTTATKTQRRQANFSSKAIRLPPMSSPGLLLPSGVSGPFRSTADPSTGLATPAAVFDMAMSMAGYTTESRTREPHRGSSIKRVIGDMFDSNVKLSLHFPRLIPEEFLDPHSSDNDDTLMQIDETSAPYRLIKALQSTQVNGVDSSSPGAKAAVRPKRKLPGFKEMAPLSLTIPYPEDYIEKREEYLNLVADREKAIVAYQEEALALDKQREQCELLGQPIPENLQNPSTVVPPIPDPPPPPSLKTLEGFNVDAFDDQHPLYPPKSHGQQKLVEHLDKDCFHIVEGRYFGLFSNTIADPHFVGPNAPGLAGLNLSLGSGLATANYSGGGGFGGSTLLAAPAQSGASANANKARDSNKVKESKGKEPSKPKIGGKGKETIKDAGEKTAEDGGHPKTGIERGRQGF